MIPINVGPGQLYTRPLDGGPWVELGRADGSPFVFAAMDDEYHTDREAVLRGIAGQTMTMEFKITRRNRRSLEILWGGIYRKRRNRRRNPLHAVRDRLRRERRWRR